MNREHKRHFQGENTGSATLTPIHGAASLPDDGSLDVSVSGHSLDDMAKTRFRTFTEILRYAMTGISGSELARLSGTSQTSVSKAMNGMHPAKGHLEKWAVALKPDKEFYDDFIRLGNDARLLSHSRNSGEVYAQRLAEFKAMTSEAARFAATIAKVLEDPSALGKGIAKNDRRVIKSLEDIRKLANRLVQKYGPVL